MCIHIYTYIIHTELRFCFEFKRQKKAKLERALLLFLPPTWLGLLPQNLGCRLSTAPKFANGTHASFTHLCKIRKSGSINCYYYYY